MLGQLLQDLRFALRGLRRNPSFAAIVVLTLALGIGANTAVFSVVNAVLLRPVAAPDPSRIVMLGTARETLPPTGGAPTRFNAWRELDALFQDISAYRYAAMNLTGPGAPQPVQVAQVSEAYFRLFGLDPARGRTFAPDEDLPNAGGFAVISHAFAQERFGSENPLGSRILLGEAPHEVIGVLRPGVRTESPEPVDVWIPFQIDPSSLDQGHFFAVAGRIRPGVSGAAIETALEGASAAFAQRFPEIGARLGGSRFIVRPIQQAIAQNARPAQLILLAAVGLVLLIACANVGSLLLARAESRSGEIALRAGLGATRSRLVRQMLAESGLLWLLGALLGLGAGMAGVRALLRLEPGRLPRLTQGVAVDWRVLAFTALAALLTGALFALYPALRASRADIRTSIFADRSSARSMLVAVQIALTLALVISSGLLIRTFFAMRAVESGFDPRNVLTMQARLDDSRYRATAGLSSLVDQSVQAIEALPGVEAAAAGCCLPIGGQPNSSFSIVGREHGDARPRANVPAVSAHFFEVHRISLLRGRLFAAADGPQSPRVALINQTLARRWWPSGGAIGAQFTIGAGSVERHEIVGIVGDVQGPSDPESGPAIYTPLAQSPDNATAYNVRRPTQWMIRTSVASASLRNAIRQEIERASGLPVFATQSMDEVLSSDTAEADFRLALMLAFGTLALLLAAVGVYGLVSQDVSQRRAEVGVRMALGADARAVRRLILHRIGKLALAGLSLGLAAAYALAGMQAGILLGVEPHDPLVFLSAPVVLSAAALAAAALPAVRAGRLQPTEALRHK